MSTTTTPVATTTQTIPTPKTDQAIKFATGVADLVQQAEQLPIVKTTLQTQFATVNNSALAPVLSAIAAIIVSDLSAHHIDVDVQLIVVALGGVVTVAAYLWQWVTIRFSKPVVVTKGII